MASKLSSFLAELKRRKVYRVAVLYAAVGVAISLGIPDLFGVLLLPDLVGKIPTAEALCEKLAQIDPLDFMTNFLGAWSGFYDGQFDHVVPASHRLLQVFPEVPYSSLSYAIALIYSGDHEVAVSVIDQSAKANPENAVTKVGLILKHGVQQDRAAAYEVMTPDFVRTCQRDCTFAHHLAGAFTLLGEKSEALDWLETSVKAGFINYPMLAEHDPLLVNIRGEERFKELMVRVKHQWETFEV